MTDLSASMLDAFRLRPRARLDHVVTAPPPGRPPPVRLAGMLAVLVVASGAGVGCGGGCSREAGTDDPQGRGAEVSAAASPGGGPDEPPPDALAGPGFELIDVSPAGPRGVRLLFGDEEAHGRVCDLFRARERAVPFAQVRCQDVDPSLAISSETRLADAVEANAPVALVVPGRGLVLADATRLTEASVLSAVAYRERIAAVLAETAGRLTLVTFQETRETARAPLSVPRSGAVGAPIIAGGHVYWLARGAGGRSEGEATPDPTASGSTAGEAEGLRLVRASLENPAGPVETVRGGLRGGAESLDVCRHGDGVLFEVGYPASDGQVRRTIVFPGEEGVPGDSPPSPEAASPGGSGVAADALLPAFAEQVDRTCRPGEAVFTWVAPALPEADPRPVVHQVRCQQGRCQAAQQPLAVPGGDPVATDLASQVVVAWSGEAGTRLRLGPLVRIDRAPDIDGLPSAEGPADWRRWVSRAGGALLLEGRATDVRALRVDSTGAVSSAKPNL